MFNKTIVRYVQQQLVEQGYEPGPLDGLYGDKTLACLSQYPEIPKDYTKRQKLTAFIQLQSQRHDAVTTAGKDGLWGPQTEYAFEQLQRLADKQEPERLWRPESLPESNPNHWPSQAREQNLIDFYGEPGENLVMLEFPYPHRLAWDPAKKVTRTQCHRKVADSLGRVLTDVLSRYGEQSIRDLGLDKYGGCYNDRKMRGGSRKSMHSWGIALDYDPGNNKLKWGRDKASFAKPVYDEWWACWEKEGWVSLGRRRNFDWMHVQAAGL